MKSLLKLFDKKLTRQEFLKLCAMAGMAVGVGSLFDACGSKDATSAVPTDEPQSNSSLSSEELAAEPAMEPINFDQALSIKHDAKFWVEASFNREYMTTPLTIECWVKLNSSDRRNIILADGYKTVLAYQLLSNHWAMFSEEKTGKFAVTLHNMTPSFIRSPKGITDGQWHYLAMMYDGSSVSLYVDAAKFADTMVSPQVKTHPLGDWSNEGPLYFGCYPPEALSCDGEIAEVRISRVAREIDRVPSGHLQADEATIGLWRFDEECTAGQFDDLSKTNNPARVIEYLPSLDENDRRAFGVRTSPLDRPLKAVEFQVVEAVDTAAGAMFGAEEILLNGPWDCTGAEPHGKSEQQMLEDLAEWEESFTAQVPCSIQTALLENNMIEDPMVLMNNLNITWVADREWWLRKTFTVPEEWRGKKVQLLFDGVDYRATFWLNGFRLGQHEGMFGGPDYDVSNLLRYESQENCLVVRLDPAPINFQDTLKNNVAYGWHYVKLVTLGIWRPVHLIMRGETVMDHPFLRTKEITNDGPIVELSLDCYHWGNQEGKLELEVHLYPKNFTGPGYSFKESLTVKPGVNHFGFSGTLEGAKLWWLVGMGDPNLYKFECVLKKGKEIVDRYRSSWGARTIEMHPNSDGPNPHLYNFQMVVNQQPIWIRGAIWCYVDALLRLDRQRIARFIELARNANIQLLRVWGGGPIENDDFYDLCDEMGMMVQQEFSLLGYHRLQNVPSIHATDITHYMVRRLRNRPSLVIWAGACEISGVGRIVEVLGRRCLELDGTRPFRRTCPYGGDVHWYGVYWGEQSLLDYRKVADGRMQAWSPGIGANLPDGPIAFTEFGLSSPPNFETWQRIIPEDEWLAWPPVHDSVFIHHTPTWEYTHVDKMNRYAGDFLNPSNLPELIKGMQLSQGLGLKILIESMRARKPQTTATYFYKLTDNYPACSWATIDYYGVPKRSYYSVQEACAPVHAMALFDDWSSKNSTLGLSIHVVNDTTEPIHASLQITLFDGQFNVIDSEALDVSIPNDRAVRVVDKNYSLPAGIKRPLFLCLDLSGELGLIDRNWYYFDFTENQGSLFDRPRTTLTGEIQRENGMDYVLIQNTGSVPALSVEVYPSAASNTHYAEQNGVWLNPGEQVKIALRRTPAVDGETRELNKLVLSAWNADDQDLLHS